MTTSRAGSCTICKLHYHYANRPSSRSLRQRNFAVAVSSIKLCALAKIPTRCHIREIGDRPLRVRKRHAASRWPWIHRWGMATSGTWPPSHPDMRAGRRRWPTFRRLSEFSFDSVLGIIAFRLIRMNATAFFSRPSTSNGALKHLRESAHAPVEELVEKDGPSCTVKPRVGSAMR